MLSSLDPVQQRRKVELMPPGAICDRVGSRVAKGANPFWLLAKLHKTSFDPRQVVEDMARLEAEKQSLEVSLKGAEARQAGLKSLISELEEKVAKTADDSIVRELEKATQARAKILDSFQDRNSREAITAEDELARAKADLARYRQQLAADAGGDRIAELQRQVQDCEIEQTELKAKLEAVTHHLQTTGPSGIVTAKHQQLEALEQTYSRAISDELRQQEQEKLYIGPRVTVISAGEPLDTSE